MARRVLIIGATSAIASEVARRCAVRGDRLYLLARNPTKLAALEAELGPAVIGSAQADLDEVDAAEARIEGALASLGGLDLALIAHGRLGDQLRSERDVGEAMATLHTNLSSVVALLVPLGRHFAEAGAGHLGVITSVAGERGRPRNFTYGAAKGGLSHYLEGLRSVLGPQGVRVHNFKLGPVDTPMTVDHPKTAVFAEVPQVAAAILRGLEGRRHVIYVPGWWRWIMLVVRNLPEPIFQRLPFLSGR
ncbi:oxidoreductase, short-chain dehydrogenase/reductase family protein [Plesiocystis pacifica SIR-1]|uniref:Oxidoreductase, short-chain dehydrogenase/reductase family protein n=1 Tax=Plesiocystis pacifica SIR-1 TaxID=391625 RepID=A6FZV0_9BACT|nr:SDR family NAD(P)-dependent oxidoreductase [Plesiocystis pacifica]EDM80906.1 oxidoreductase, short-chain dehydrogenase/reductase family protein [Plesiocystis pacifica SIR-1]